MSHDRSCPRPSNRSASDFRPCGESSTSFLGADRKAARRHCTRGAGRAHVGESFLFNHGTPCARRTPRPAKRLSDRTFLLRAVLRPRARLAPEKLWTEASVRHTNQLVWSSSRKRRSSRHWPLRPHRNGSAASASNRVSAPQMVVTASSMIGRISARGIRARARIDIVWRVADATRASRRGSASVRQFARRARIGEQAPERAIGPVDRLGDEAVKIRIGDRLGGGAEHREAAARAVRAAEVEIKRGGKNAPELRPQRLTRRKQRRETTRSRAFDIGHKPADRARACRRRRRTGSAGSSRSPR